LEVSMRVERGVSEATGFRRVSKFLAACLLIGSFLATFASAAPDAAKVYGDLRLYNGGGIVFSDGSIQSKATVQGPTGPQGPAGPQGPTGQVTLAAICDAISAENMPLPSFCRPPITGDFLGWTGSIDATNSFQLVRLNGTTGAVTKIGGSDFFPALVYGADGKLYGMNSELHIINTVDGSTVRVGSFNYEGASVLMCSASLSPDGTMYVIENASPKRMFKVNMNSAALTYVGNITATIRGIAFAPEGTLYGTFADLYTLSSLDGSTLSTIGNTGYYISSPTFGAGSSVYGIDMYPSTQLFNINLATGSASPVTTLGSGNLVALVAEHRAASTLSKTQSLATVPQQRNIDQLLNLERQFIEGQKADSIR